MSSSTTLGEQAPRRRRSGYAGRGSPRPPDRSTSFAGVALGDHVARQEEVLVEVAMTRRRAGRAGPSRARRARRSTSAGPRRPRRRSARPTSTSASANWRARNRLGAEQRAEGAGLGGEDGCGTPEASAPNRTSSRPSGASTSPTRAGQQQPGHHQPVHERRQAEPCCHSPPSEPPGDRRDRPRSSPAGGACSQ